ncbi:MAG: dienelactone hydrolase family protein [Euzebya sp.]
MSQIALFHSVLGVRPGIMDAASRLEAAGHEVMVVDQYDGLVFDDYDTAMGHAESIGYPALMQMATDAVEDLPDGFIAAGFSNGGGMAEYVATQRSVSGVAMMSGALPLEMLQVDAWPAGVPAQIHYTVDDPFRTQEFIDSVASSVAASGSRLEVFDYPGSGHLFADRSLPKEYDRASATLLWQRLLDFCAATATV